MQSAGHAGSDPDTQVRQVLAAGVDKTRIYHDVGVSGGTATRSRQGWRAVNGKLRSGDVLVVAAVDRIGRRWTDTLSVLRDLRGRQVRVRSLALSEAQWMRYFDADPDTPEAFIGDILASFMTWAAQQELESIRRRTKAGLDKARAQGKTLGTPRKLSTEQVALAQRLKRDKVNNTQIGKALGVSRTTVRRYLQDEGPPIAIPPGLRIDQEV